jgi:hypothetical protein
MAADNLGMGTAIGAAPVNCAGIAVVTLARMDASFLRVTSIISAGIVVIAVWSRAGDTTCGRIAGFNTIAGIAVIAIYGCIHTLNAVKGIFGAGIAVIALCGCMIAVPLVTIIVVAGISIIAVLWFILALPAVESVLGARIMVVAFMMIRRICYAC